MKTIKGGHRAFYWLNKSWYAANEQDEEIMFGIYCDNGGSFGEISVTWRNISNSSIPMLKIYDDAWFVLTTIHDLLFELGQCNSENIPPEKFIEILKRCGFKDKTQYKRKAIVPKYDEEKLRSELDILREKAHEIETILIESAATRLSGG